MPGEGIEVIGFLKELLVGTEIEETLVSDTQIPVSEVRSPLPTIEVDAPEGKVMITLSEEILALGRAHEKLVSMVSDKYCDQDFKNLGVFEFMSGKHYGTDDQILWH